MTDVAKIALSLVCALAVSGPALANDDAERRPRGRNDVDVIVPIDPHPPKMEWFGRRDHHVAPGTVTINKAPYMCDPDRRTFRDREAFVAHLRVDHGLAPERIPDELVLLDGVVHFAGSTKRSGVDSP